jgi:multiple sugar transport system permease protein
METMNTVTATAAGDGTRALSTVALWKSRRDRERVQWGSFMMLSPALVLLVVLFAIPVAYSAYLGLTNERLIGPQAVSWKFTGTANLSRLASDTLFRQSLYLTAFFVVGSVVGVAIVGLGLAMLIQRCQAWLRVIVGGIVVVAWMMPAVNAGLTWYAATASGGTFATLIGDSHADLINSQPMLIVTLANIWSQAGFAMLVLGAALRTIPGEVLESADVEDASRWQRFRFIILPMLRPALLAVVLLVTLLSLANFALIYVMTQGGPGTSTEILPLYSYQQAFQFDNLAYGALIGNAMVILCAIFGVLYVRATRQRVAS